MTVGREYLITWPKHDAGLVLTHNLHKNYYRTVQEEIDANAHGYVDWVDNEQMQKAIETNDCWTLQWYPRTPVSFCILSAHDLDVLLAKANAE